QYTSLSDRIKDRLVEDEHFWRIVPYSKWIIFQSLNQIFIYDLDSDTFKIIADPNGIVFVYKVNDAILFQVPGNGIYEIENGEKQLICNDAQIIHTRIINIFPNGDDLLLVTEANGLFKLKNGKVERISSPLRELLGTTNIYSALQRANGDLVLGTISRGVIIASAWGSIKYHLSHTDGIGNNTVLSVFEDNDHNIWLGLDNGISCINIQSPIRTYYDHEGVLGTVYTAISYNDRLYVGTNQGLFSRELNSEGAFRLVQGTNGQAWSLFIKEGQLFCGHNRGTFLVHGVEARLISNIEGVWKFLEVPGHPDWLLQGSYGGLSILERSGNDSWKLRNRISGFDYSSMNFEFFNDTTLYVSHEHKGVFRVLLNPEYTRAINTEKLQELEKGKSASLVKFNSSLLYANRKGVFRLMPGDDKFIKDSILTHIIEGNEFFTGKMVVDDIGKLWFFTKNGIHYLSQEKLSGAPVVKDISIPLSLRKTVGGFENIAHITNNTYLTGSKSGFFTIDLDQVEEKEYELILNRILISDLKKNISFYAPLSENGNFENSDNNINFSFSIPEYEKYVLAKYQYKLEGLYDYWSDWSADATARFENLPHGNYRFYVRGKVGNNITSNSAIYEFTIQRPWYLSSGMLAIYGLCIVLGAILVHTLYKRYYRDQEQKLIEQNKRELELTRTQNEKELIRLKNEKLRQDIKNKSKELAASTMNVVRKNELLTDIKEHLLSV
ncbi:MAG: LuxR family transcriptional regulator, partial [Flavobacteriaceae bacterium]|nr:LuxR family transcriptional regulator [Flavobacteriaceae bacterium]